MRKIAIFDVLMVPCGWARLDVALLGLFAIGTRCSTFLVARWPKHVTRASAATARAASGTAVRPIAPLLSVALAHANIFAARPRVLQHGTNGARQRLRHRARPRLRSR